MRLFEAIRLGAILRPQAFGAFFLNGGSCAMGAALEAFGIVPTIDLVYVYPISPEIDALMTAGAVCPLKHHCGTRTFTGSLLQVVAHLNDYHRWTREEIASWVEQVEMPTATAVTKPAETELVCA